MAHLPLLGVLDIRRNRPPLRTLILENCKMIEPDLVRFVLCVSETLKTLRVINLYLTKGSRQTLFEFLGGELTLENATINGLFQQSDHYDDTAVNPFRPVVKPENLPFPFTLDDDVALDWFCRQEIKNPYASDKWLVVPRPIDDYRQRPSSVYLPYSCHRTKDLARYYPSNIFTTIEVTIWDMGFPRRSWSRW